MVFDSKIPLIGAKVDLCLFDAAPVTLDISNAKSYIALGKCDGGLDPSVAEKHWKITRAEFERIRQAFALVKKRPRTFFIGCAIKKKMAIELWEDLQRGTLSNVANPNDKIKWSYPDSNEHPSGIVLSRLL